MRRVELRGPDLEDSESGRFILRFHGRGHNFSPWICLFFGLLDNKWIESESNEAGYTAEVIACDCRLGGGSDPKTARKKAEETSRTEFGL